MHLHIKQHVLHWFQRLAITNQVEDLLPFHRKHPCCLLRDIPQRPHMLHHTCRLTRARSCRQAPESNIQNRRYLALGARSRTFSMSFTNTAPGASWICACLATERVVDATIGSDLGKRRSSSLKPPTHLGELVSSSSCLMFLWVEDTYLLLDSPPTTMQANLHLAVAIQKRRVIPLRDYKKESSATDVGLSPMRAFGRAITAMKANGASVTTVSTLTIAVRILFCPCHIEVLLHSLLR